MQFFTRALFFLAGLCFVLANGNLRFSDEFGYNEAQPDLNLRPIIGIMTQAMDFAPESIYPKGADTKNASEYIAASYVKLMEAAGARVVAIRYNQSKEELFTLFSKLNGVLLPGGGVPLTPGEPFYESGVALWEYIEKKEPAFPVLGICLGMEWMASLAAGTREILDKSGHFNASNIAFNLKLRKAAWNSKLFHEIMHLGKIVFALEHSAITFNEHEMGVTPEAFHSYKKLDDNYDILATSFDITGKEFVAAFEHKTKDIMAVQFHPEKNVFEWFPTGNFPHTPEAVQFSQMIGNNFIEKARKNKNSFKDVEEETRHLIQNHARVYLGMGSYFQEAFIFYKDEPQVPPKTLNSNRRVPNSHFETVEK